jgi:hypothetical protein
MAINLNSTTPSIPSGSEAVIFQNDASGNVSAYVAGGPTTPASFDAAAQTANIGSTTLIASVPTSGRYRVSAYVIVTTPDGASSSLPAVHVAWTDADNTNGQTVQLFATNTGNSVTTWSSGDIFLSADATTSISFSTSGYASGTPATMQYAIHVVVEAL